MMVLNAKIVEKKTAQILAILNQDGGTTPIEAWGLFHYIGLMVANNMAAAQEKVTLKPRQSYADLKARRLDKMT